MSYKELKSFQHATIIYDLTVEFCNKYIDRTNRPNGTSQSYKTYSRMSDQMIQAARSGKQNIAEASANPTSEKSELMLLGVARASFSELLEDYEDFLRQNNLSKWEKDDKKILEIRQMVYRSDMSDRSNMTNKTNMSDGSDRSNKTNMSDMSDKSNMTNKTNVTDGSDMSDRSNKTNKTNMTNKTNVTDGSDRTNRTNMTNRTNVSDRSNMTNKTNKTNMTYWTYMESPEPAANLLISLIHQTNYLLDQQIRSTEAKYKKDGDYKDQLKRDLKQSWIDKRKEEDKFVKELLEKLNKEKKNKEE